MKVTIFALVVAFCVAAASANTVGFENAQTIFDLEYSPETAVKGIVDPDTLCIFTKFYWVARAALQTLKGVNCTIKQVLIIKATAEKFLNDIQNCGTEAVNIYKNVVQSAKSVIATCDKIINLNEKVCNNDGSNESKKTTWNCFFKLVNQVYTLNKQVRNTISAVKKLPSIPSETAKCTNTATNLLTNAFVSFPENVKTCSKLTSK